jgi:hypothetical protein
LDNISLQTYFRRLGPTPEAQDLLIGIRSSPPSRSPDNRAGNMPVWYPFKKMQCIIKAESAKVELRPFCMILAMWIWRRKSDASEKHSSRALAVQPSKGKSE